MITVIFIIAIVFLIGCFYILYRNNKVCDFRLWMVDNLVFTDHNYTERLKVFKSVRYSEMLYSFKPLKLSSFYSDWQIKILMS